MRTVIEAPVVAPAPELEVELPARPEAARLARRALEAVAPGLHPETFAKLRLLVTELVIAAMPVHAPDEQLVLTVTTVEGRIRAQLRDPSVDGDDTPRPRGWGLFLVQRLAAEWGRDEDGVIWFELTARSRTARA